MEFEYLFKKGKKIKFFVITPLIYTTAILLKFTDTKVSYS